ncbi:MAG: transcription elongation factor GreA [Clostridiales bacterium]|jgi:transcription elongation factor GreA|nr:transcription elongation factor GreA [Clostridiales bacterium]
MPQDVLLTYEGLRELQEELEHLRSVGRKEAAEKIKTALSFGDLSENSEYDEAKSEQGKLESRILEIESMLRRAKILEEDVVSETVQIGSKVIIKAVARGAKPMELRITGYAQANPAEGRISDESPLGKALIGKRAGDKVTVEAPKGAAVYKIVEISSGSKKQ